MSRKQKPSDRCGKRTTTARGLFLFVFPFFTRSAPSLSLCYNRTMNEKESRISKENRMLRKANWELDDENKELKRRVEELEEENKRLDETIRSMKDQLFKVMVENEELKRRN